MTSDHHYKYVVKRLPVLTTFLVVLFTMYALILSDTTNCCEFHYMIQFFTTYISKLNSTLNWMHKNSQEKQ